MINLVIILLFFLGLLLPYYACWKVAQKLSNKLLG